MSLPLTIGLIGSGVVAFGVLALWLILRPVDPDAQPPTDEASLNWQSDPRVDSLFRELWRFVATTAVGASAILAALVWELSTT